MTKPLEQALAEVAKLPEAEQKATTAVTWGAAVIWRELEKHGRPDRKALLPESS